MHDLAKCFEPQKLLHMPPQKGLTLDDIFSASPHLLRADVSSIVTINTFELKEKQVLNATVHRTLCRPSMSQLCNVVFLADTLEAGHNNAASLQALKQVSRKNIVKGSLDGHP